MMHLQVLQTITDKLVLSFYGLEELMPKSWTEESTIPKKREFITNKAIIDRNPELNESFISDPFGLKDNLYR